MPKPKYKLSLDEKDGTGSILKNGGVIYEIDNDTFNAEQGRVILDLLEAGHPTDWDSLESLFDEECKRRGVDCRAPCDRAETAGEG